MIPDLDRLEAMIAEYGEYDHGDKLSRIHGTATIGEFVDILAELRQARIAQKCDAEHPGVTNDGLVKMIRRLMGDIAGVSLSATTADYILSRLRTRLAALEQPGVSEGKVEQAAQAIFDAANISLASLLGYVSWDKCSHDDKERYRAMARCAARTLAPAPIGQGGETADDVRKRVEGALRLAVACINAGKPISVIEVVQFALQPPAGDA